MKLHPCSLTLLVLAIGSSPVAADTVLLKNGRKIYGKVSEARSTDAVLVLEFDGQGSATLSRSAVQSFEKNSLIAPPAEPTAAPAPAAAPVAVPSRPVPVVLRTDAAAKPATAAAEPVQGTRTVRTTHRVVLKNGGKLMGSVAPGAESDPLKIEIPTMGWTLIPRSRIASVEEAAAELKIEEEPPAAEAPAAGVQPATTGEGTQAAKTEPSTAAKNPLAPEVRALIEENVRELTRWRTRNRVRAENALIALGADALPFLDGVARDPFELTRRAVMRIVRAIGDPIGLPMAIDSLLDEDEFVRNEAAEAVRRIARRDFGYNAYAPEPRRLAAHRRVLQWWEEELGAKEGR